MPDTLTLFPLDEAEPSLPGGLAEMHRLYGTKARRCGDCAFFQRAHPGGHWFKCGKAAASTRRSALHWRAFWQACGLLQEA